jgi:LacI family transcriptional regulator
MARSSRQSVTIRHVAAEAGVSLQTVSRVMNDEPNVRAEVQERVRAAVAKLGYVPSLAARRLSGSRSYLLLALNDRDRTVEGWRLGLGSDWIDQMLLGGMLTCAEHDYRLIVELVDTHAAHVERAVSSALAALRPDGVILTPPHSDNPAITSLLQAQRVPFARIGSELDGAGFAIRMDERAAAAAAAEHLVSLGHRRIAYIAGDPEYALSARRLQGYRDIVRQHGLDDDAALVQQGDFGFASGERAMVELLALPAPPTAIIASSDQMALGALHVAHRENIEVPGDVSLISFDDSPVAKFSVPPLTAINQPVAAMAARAATLLIEAAAGKGDAVSHDVVPFHLAVRGSTAPPRAA